MTKKTKQLLTDREIARLVYVQNNGRGYMLCMPECLVEINGSARMMGMDWSFYTLAMDVQRAVRKHVRSSVKLQEQIIAAKAREATLGD